MSASMAVKKKTPNKAEVQAHASMQKASWKVETWEQGGNFVGFRVLRGAGDTLEIAKGGAFVVDIYAYGDNPQSRNNSRDTAIKLANDLNKEMADEKNETRIAAQKVKDEV